MSFKQFLFEKKDSPYKIQTLEESEIYDLVNKHCSNMRFDRPYWRGMRGEAKGYILHGEVGNRKSINTSNHYTLIIDHCIEKYGEKDWPKRSKSIICANYPHQEHAKSFGAQLYAIFPFDDITIGVCPGEDIWEVKFTGNKRAYFSITSLNAEFEENNIHGNTYQELVEDLKRYMAGSDSSEKLHRLFADSDIEEKLKELYFDEIGFEYMKSKEVNKITDRREVWMSGKCIAVSYQAWNNIVNNIK